MDRDNAYAIAEALQRESVPAAAYHTGGNIWVVEIQRGERIIQIGFAGVFEYANAEQITYGDSITQILWEN